MSEAWVSLPDLARRALPGLPTTVKGLHLLAQREGWMTARNARSEPLARPREGRGGGLMFHVTLLPEAARIALQGPAAALTAAPTREEQWAAFDRLPSKKTDEARRRLEILQRVEQLAITGGRTAAVAAIAAEAGVAKASIYAWFKLVESIEKGDRLPLLAPRHAGGQARVEIAEDLLNRFKNLWLRPEQPSDVACWRETRKLAKQMPMPPLAVFMRRLKATVSAETILVARGGDQAIKNAYPAQRRDRSGLRALEAINADTHIWDVMVQWPDGTTGRPAMTAAQDLYSNKMLAWRISRTPSSDVIRLMLGDVFGKFGLPDVAVFDNGRDFASKAITGGVPNRYRFKYSPEDPVGVLTALAVQVHFTKPYSGQSKPIERAFRDFATDIAKHPAFAGAYTGNSTTTKPSNYGSRTVPYDVFTRVIDAEIQEWNAREGRRTAVAAGRSFDQVFAESYAETPIRKPTAEQLRFCLLKSEAVTPDRRDGSVSLLGNRYWSDGMASLIGQRVVVRFDAQNLWQPIFVYSIDGRYLCAADCTDAAGFLDADSGRQHGRAVAAMTKAAKMVAKAEGLMESERLARLAIDMLPPETPAATTPETKVVRPVFNLRTGGAALAADAIPETLSFNERERLALARRAAREESQLRLVE